MPCWLKRICSSGNKSEAAAGSNDGGNDCMVNKQDSRVDVNDSASRMLDRSKGAISTKYECGLLYSTMGFRDSLEVVALREKRKKGEPPITAANQIGAAAATGDKRGSHASTVSQEVILQPILSQSQSPKSPAGKSRRASENASDQQHSLNLIYESVQHDCM